MKHKCKTNEKTQQKQQTPSDLWPLQVETVAALRVVEPGGLEDEPVLSAPSRPRPLAAGVGQQHLREAHLHGAEGALREALQEEGAFAVARFSRVWQVSHRRRADALSPPWQAHLHHYLQVEGMEQSLFCEATECLDSLIDEYQQLDATRGRLTPDAARLAVARWRSAPLLPLPIELKRRKRNTTSRQSMVCVNVFISYQPLVRRHYTSCDLVSFAFCLFVFHLSGRIK